MEKLSKELTAAYLADDYGDDESLNNMIDRIVPEGCVVRTYSDSVTVYQSIEELGLCEDDIATLKEGLSINLDDVCILTVRN